MDTDNIRALALRSLLPGLEMARDQISAQIASIHAAIQAPTDTSGNTDHSNNIKRIEATTFNLTSKSSKRRVLTDEGRERIRAAARKRMADLSPAKRKAIIKKMQDTKAANRLKKQKGL